MLKKVDNETIKASLQKEQIGFAHLGGELEISPGPVSLVDPPMKMNSWVMPRAAVDFGQFVCRVLLLSMN